jgi:hypothetical protein
MSEWTSVEDELPDDDVLVLVCWRDDDECYRVDFDAYEDELWAVWFNQAEHTNIAGGSCEEEAPYTHWMNIPGPPK